VSVLAESARQSRARHKGALERSLGPNYDECLVQAEAPLERLAGDLFSRSCLRKSAGSGRKCRPNCPAHCCLAPCGPP